MLRRPPHFSSAVTVYLQWQGSSDRACVVVGRHCSREAVLESSYLGLSMLKKPARTRGEALPPIIAHHTTREFHQSAGASTSV